MKKETDMTKKHLFHSSTCLLCATMFAQGCSVEKTIEPVPDQTPIGSGNVNLLENASKQGGKAQLFFEIAEKMEKKGEYDLSAKFLLKAANEPFLLSNFETLLSMTQRQIDLLSQANAKSGPSLFAPPDKAGVFWETIKKNSGVRAVAAYRAFSYYVYGISAAYNTRRDLRSMVE